MSGEMLFAKFLAQRLCLINGQAVVRSVPWVEADDIVAVSYTHLNQLVAQNEGDDDTSDGDYHVFG